jgi:asparagine synthase (glutamine-hydrolysing)
MRGADPDTVRRALDAGDPLPGTAGFAGELDGRLVRDVLGRQPLFGTPDEWAFDPAALADADPVPAGHVRDADGDSRRFDLPDPAPATDDDAALDAVERAVRSSVRAVDGDVAVAFSGGLDSALVAAGVPDAPCYVTGFPESDDVAAARAAADAMDRDLRAVELAHDDIERAVPDVVAATGRDDPMAVSIALPLYLVAERVAADGFDRLALGQGADELFGGYEKVVDPANDDRVAATTVRGAVRETIRSLPAQAERDVPTLRAAGVAPVTPLLHDGVIEAALPLPGHLLATADERKVALRRAGEGWLPSSVVDADKRAVQYGSLVARELDRLARQAGFKRRMDDHLGRYVRSLC